MLKRPIMRYNEPTGRTVLSAAALTIAFLLGTSAFEPVLAPTRCSAGSPEDGKGL